MKGKTKIKIRYAEYQDIDDILMIEEEAWKHDFQRFKKEHILSQLEVFPEGVICALVDEKVMGFVVVERVDCDTERGYHPTWYEITDNGFIRNTHKKTGDTLYGVNLSVYPLAPRGVSDALMEAVAKLAISLNVKQVVLGGRIPRYHKYKEQYTPEEYIHAKKGNRYLDPEIYIYHKAGLEILGVIPNYFEDPESLNYGVLLRWKNPFYNRPHWIRWLFSKLFKIL